MPTNSSDKQVRIDLEARVWKLRQHGWTQQRISDEVGIDQSNISRMLAKIEAREYKRLSATIEQSKATQAAILEHVVDESLQAWERSKKPKRRASERFGVVDAQGKSIPSKSVDVLERDGEPAYLDRALLALGQLRKLWGIDAPPPAREVADDGVITITDIAKRIAENAEKFERQPSDDDAGGGAMHDGPQPL